jgi:hypothetical protein
MVRRPSKNKIMNILGNALSGNALLGIVILGTPFWERNLGNAILGTILLL